MPDEQRTNFLSGSEKQELEIREVADRLIVAYARNTLSPEQRTLFETNFLTDERRVQLRMALRLAESLIEESTLRERQRREACRAFLCGTYEDLKEERTAVLQALDDMGVRRDAMENFGARSNRPIAECLSEISQATVVIVVTAHRYGSIVPGLDLSFAEVEYNEARRLRKPCLVYVPHPEVPVLARNFESDPERMRRLNRFREVLTEQNTVARFRSPSDLAARITLDLEQLLSTPDVAPSPESGDGIGPAGKLNTLIEQAIADGLDSDLVYAAARSGVIELLRRNGKRTALVSISCAPADAWIRGAAEEQLRLHGIELIQATAESARNEEALHMADVAVLLLSHASFLDPAAVREFRLAGALRWQQLGLRMVLPVLLEDVEVPATLRNVPALDLRRVSQTLIVDEVVRAIVHNWGGRGVVI